MNNSKAVLFTNWTESDFRGQWAKVGYDIPSGESMHLPEYLANHFAKHLVDQYFNEAGLATNHQDRKRMLAKCFGEVTEGEDATKAEVEAMNKNVKKPAKKKPAKKTAKKPKKEKEFEDLKK